MTIFPRKSSSARDLFSDFGEITPTLHFGRSLKAIIEERGVSIREAAKQIEVAHPQLLRWLNQGQIPKQETVERIAQGLEIPVTKLLPPKIQENIHGLEAKVNTLKAQLENSNEEITRLRWVILDVARADIRLKDKPGDHQIIEEARFVWRRLFLEGIKIEQGEMLRAIEEIEVLVNQSGGENEKSNNLGGCLP